MLLQHACQLAKQKALRRRSAPFVSAVSPLVPAACRPMPRKLDDFTTFVRAECGDEVFTRRLMTCDEPGMRGQRQQEGARATAIMTSVQRVRQSSGNGGMMMKSTSSELGNDVLLLHETKAVLANASHALFNHINCPLWLPVLQRLHHRGALTPRDRVHARRYVSAATHATLLPWLWAMSSTAVAADASRDNRIAAQPLDGDEAVTDGTKSDLLSRLSTAGPSQWPALANSITPSLADGPMHLWHDFLFTLARSTAFARGAVELHEAHAALLAVLDRFYSALASSEYVRHRYSCLGRADKKGTVTPLLVLLPPLFLRHCRRHYRRQHALRAFARLVCFCVVSEERVLCTLQTASSSASATVRSVWCTTALLADHDVFDFFLSIPGRRENGLDWQVQWQLARDYAGFAFVRLYRQLMLAAGAPSPSPLLCTSDDAAGSTLSKAAQIFFNVCFWVRNNNEEGTRCVQGLRILLESYGRGTGTAEGRTVPRCIVHTLCQAALQCMRTKAEQLHYGPLPGLLQVQTCVAMLVEGCHATSRVQSAGEGEGEGVWRARQKDCVLPTWLNVREGTSMSVIWHAVRHHHRARAIACYALTHLGFDLLCSLCEEAESVRACRRDETVAKAASQRLQHQRTQLMEWAVNMCQPLCLTAAEVAEVWDGQLRARALADVRATAWLHWWSKLAHCGDAHGQHRVDGGKATRSACTGSSSSSGSSAHNSSGGATCDGNEANDTTRWICGCGASNARRRHHALTCVTCVVRGGVPFMWQCPTCHWTARAGEPLERCVRCGRDHPALTPAAAPMYKAQNAALVYCCTACGRYTSPVSGLDCGECAACGAARQDGYWLAAASWRCGCGAVHPVTRRYCPCCTYAALASATAADQVRDTTSRQDDTDNVRNLPRYTCPHCASAVHLTGGDDDEAPAAESAVRGRCQGCTSPHPCEAALCTQSRLCVCPQCHYYTAARGTHCSHCRSPMLSLVQDLLPTYADRPWCCHACGFANPVRDQRGCPLPVCASEEGSYGGAWGGQADGGASSACERRCGRCHTLRPSFAAFGEGIEGEEGECPSWYCGACGAQGNQGYSCDKCYALHPLLAGRPEVHLWGCAVCRTTLNASWQRHCRHPGCPGLHEEAALIVCYSPYYCTQCGFVSRSVHWPVCEHCGYRPTGQAGCVDADEAAALQVAVGAVECEACRRARALDLGGGASQRSRTPSPSLSHASTTECPRTVSHPTPPLTAAAAMSAAMTLSCEARLGEVEACLLQASQHATQQDAPQRGAMRYEGDDKRQPLLHTTCMTQRVGGANKRMCNKQPASSPRAPPPPLLPGVSAPCSTHATHS